MLGLVNIPISTVGMYLAQGIRQAPKGAIYTKYAYFTACNGLKITGSRNSATNRIYFDLEPYARLRYHSTTILVSLR